MSRPSDLDLNVLYVDRKMSLVEVAAHYGRSIGTIQRWLADAGIPSRPAGRRTPPRPSAEDLRRDHHDRRLSLTDLAKKHGVYQATVRKWFDELEIPRLSRSELMSLPRPSKKQLEAWYHDELMSAEDIGLRLNISASAALRWLNEAGISLRTCGNSLASRGKRAPTAEELQRHVWQEYLGYREIAEIYGCDFTAIPHWLDEYGIERPTVWDTRRAGEEPSLPSQDQLRDQYEAGKSLRTIAAEFGTSPWMISELCLDAGIDLRRDGWGNGRRHFCADGHEVRSVYEQRVDDWLYSHVIKHEVDPPLPGGGRFRGDFLVGDIYVEVWGVRGNSAYEQRKKAKRAIYQAAGCTLIELPYWSFHQDDLWRRRLSESLLPR